MITPAHAQTMARYNSWQNRSLYDAADTLDDAARKQDRGAFWGSIHGTLAHILWGDELWMSRFASWPAPVAQNVPATVTDVDDWTALKAAREAFDSRVEAWFDGLPDDWLAGDLTWYSGIMASDVTKPRWILITHFFNHQTHHRGQVHCMLTQADAKPDDTDLPFMPALTGR